MVERVVNTVQKTPAIAQLEQESRAATLEQQIAKVSAQLRSMPYWLGICITLKVFITIVLTIVFFIVFIVIIVKFTKKST